MQAILDNTPALIYIIGVDGRMQFANAEWYRVFGSVYGNPIVGRYLTDYLTPEHAAFFFQENEIMLAQDSVMTFENDVSLPDGVHTFLRTKFSLRDAEGNIYAFCGVSLDITQRKQIEIHLRSSEQRLQAIFDNVPLGLYITGNQGCEFANHYWLSLMGLTLESALGIGWMQAIHPEDREWVLRESIEAKNASRSFEAEYRFVDRDGNIYWMLDRAVPIRDHTDQVQFYQGFLLDITERKRAEERLRFQSNVLSQVNDAVIAIDNAQCITYWNNGAERLYNLKSDQVLGQALEVAYQYCWLTVEDEKAAYDSLAATGAWHGENIHRKKTGEEIYVESSVSLLKDTSSATVGQLAVIRDITQRKRAEEVLRASVQELERLNRLKDDFLSTVSHELRTPITNMKMAIHMLKISLEPERQQRYLEILHTECTREAQLINDLLDLQRLEATSYPVSLEPLNLQDFLPSILEPFRSRTQECQQTFQLNFSPNVPTLLCNRANLERILAELLNNACKYTPAGGTITLSIRYDPKQPAHVPDSTPITIFSIRNSAEIPATELPRIFEKFYRVSNAEPWKQGGTGLGLALVQKLVDQLQGTIEVESDQGWTTFSVQLPNQPNS
jgi:PAS domain S-box-containing protein